MVIMQHNLKADEDQPGAVVEALSRSMALMKLDLDGTIISANGNFCRIVGYDEQELIGQDHSILVHPDDAAGQDYVLLWDRLRRGEFVKSEFRRIAKDGREVWLQATYNPIVGGCGRPTAVMKAAMDITLERHRASTYRDIYEALSRSTALLEMNLDGIIIQANQLYLGMMGYHTLDILGRHHRIFVDPADAATPAYSSFWERLRPVNTSARSSGA